MIQTTISFTLFSYLSSCIFFCECCLASSGLLVCLKREKNRPFIPFPSYSTWLLIKCSLKQSFFPSKVTRKEGKIKYFCVRLFIIRDLALNF